MRNKVAKQLRKQARHIEPWYSIKPLSIHHVNYGTKQDPNYVPIANTMRMENTCGRYTYKKLKRNYSAH